MSSNISQEKAVMLPRFSAIRSGFRIHRLLGWPALVCLLMFALSGSLHPLMVWTGPQAAQFFPPQAKITAEQVGAMPLTLKRNGILDAGVVKLVPGEKAVLLQVTEPETLNRRYFDLQNGEELPNFDREQAVWLARYYTGSAGSVAEAALQTEFSAAYPWVNRLLPVWRIRFEGSGNLTAFVHTESLALANLTNDWKTTLQGAFAALHTWNWLDASNTARILCLSLLLFSLLAVALAGSVLRYKVKTRPIKDDRRRWHRRAAGWLWLPLIGFVASGLFHLWKHGYADPSPRGLQLAEMAILEPEMLQTTLGPLPDEPLNAVSLIWDKQHGWLYRLALPQGKPGEAITPNQRFDGQPVERPALYLDSSSGQPVNITDADLARQLASRFAGQSVEQPVPITRFGPDYDFRNKRLPVWKAETPDRFLFIDPASGQLVDQLLKRDMPELYSFSILHKWNLLVPLIGRETRDAVMLGLMLAFSAVALLGGWMLVKRHRRG